MRALTQALLNHLFPPQCLSCATPVAEFGGLCGECFVAMPWVKPPFCHSCGQELEEDTDSCAQCISQPPAFVAARAATAYDDISRSLITQFKYADRLYLAPLLARWMARSYQPLLRDTDLIIPVPLHWRRQAWRRFNQSALLVKALSKETNLPHNLTTLQRIRATKPQTGQSKAARQRNLRGAFAVPTKRAHIINGKVIMLVDDVFTTGSTLQACSKALLKAGAKEVRVLTFAKRML